MKLSNLIWVLALAGAAAACNTGPAISGCVIDPTTGLCSTEGGECGDLVDACLNPADDAAYAALEYTDTDGVMYMGPDAASAIGSDCIFGSVDSDPPLAGCSSIALQVIPCSPNCPAELIDELTTCVTDCTQDATGLSDECMSCTGDTVACGAAFCTMPCVADTNAAPCIECRCNNNCIQCYDICSGLPSDGDCE